MVTEATWPVLAFSMNSLKLITLSRCWKFTEKFQISTATRTSTIQNSRLLSVEFKLVLPSTSRLPRPACAR